MNPSVADDLADHLTCIALAMRVIRNPRISTERQVRALDILSRSTDEAQRCREQLAVKN